MDLEISHLHLSLGGNAILKDVSLYVEDGAFISILGKSGCGKSSLLKCIAGLLETTGGSIKMQGRDITGLLPEKRQTVIVFQDLRLFPHMNVEQNITFSMALRGMKKEQMKKEAALLLEQVQLPGFEKRRISSLSGGQMQRVALARALGANPHILLLDEPFSGLDEDLRRDMGRLVKDLHRKNGITSIMVSHDKEEAMQLSDRIALMKEGRILQYGTPFDLFHLPRSKEVAAFMGEVNVFPGQVENGRFSCALGSFATDKPAGSYSLLLRPGNLLVLPGEGAYRVGEIWYRGESVILLAGEQAEYQIRLSYEEFMQMQIQGGSCLGLAMRPGTALCLCKEE